MSDAPDRFLNATRRLPVECTPVWYQRQAGRHMPRFAAYAERFPFIEMVEAPEIVADVTVEPVDGLGVDAAIVFADILLIPRAMGFPVDYVPYKGPQLASPLREPGDILRLDPSAAREGMAPTLAGIALAARRLDGRAPIIGFAGGPFTVAAYMVEGRGGQTECPRTKRLYRSDPEQWTLLMDRLTEATIDVCLAQIEAGVAAIELFESWAGALTAADYRQYVLPWSQRIFSAVRQHGAAGIHFGLATGALLEAMHEAGAGVFGLDWRVPLGEAWQRLGHETAIQGNLDPTWLWGPEAGLEVAIQAVLDQAGGRPGHIFSLGHGVDHTVDPGLVRHSIDLVHALSARGPIAAPVAAG